jgi:hypothetical protein
MLASGVIDEGRASVPAGSTPSPTCKGGLTAERGYTEHDIDAILGGNWLSLLQRTLPQQP